jgi:NitT/TauT family transport system substrate-binding protein
MSRRSFFQRSALVASAVGLGSLVEACSSAPSTAPAKATRRTSVTLQLDFLPFGRYAPYYYASSKGFYARRNLDVTIVPSTGTGPALEQLVAGRCQALFVDIPSTMDLMGKDPHPLMRSYAVIYAKAPETVFFFEGGDIRTPKDLDGKTIATSAGSTDFELFPLFAKANGIDYASIHWDEVAASAKVSLLLEHKVDATTTYIMGLPDAEAGLSPGEKLGYFTYGDYGVDVYGNGIVFTDDYAKANPDVVRAFVEASLEGYLAAFANPEAAVEAMAAEVPTLKTDVAVKEIAIVEQLAYGPAQRVHGIGYQAPSAMKASYDAVIDVLHQPISVPLDELYSNAYV